MAKAARNSFVCQNCGSVSTRWAGKCASCGEWNTIVEEAAPAPGPAGGGLRIPGVEMAAGAHRHAHHRLLKPLEILLSLIGPVDNHILLVLECLGPIRRLNDFPGRIKFLAEEFFSVAVFRKQPSAPREAYGAISC